MSGTVIRLIIVGVAFSILGLFPPFDNVEHNLASFLAVAVLALIAEVFYATRTVEQASPTLNNRVDTIRRSSRLTSSLAPTPASTGHTGHRRRPQAATGSDAPYDPIAAARLQDHHAPTDAPSKPTHNKGAESAISSSHDSGSSHHHSDSHDSGSSSGGDGGGGGGD